jgi:hypothetical protein
MLMRLGFLLLNVIEFKGFQTGPGCGEAQGEKRKDMATPVKTTGPQKLGKKSRSRFYMDPITKKIKANPETFQVSRSKNEEVEWSASNHTSRDPISAFWCTLTGRKVRHLLRAISRITERVLDVRSFHMAIPSSSTPCGSRALSPSTHAELWSPNRGSPQKLGST